MKAKKWIAGALSVAALGGMLYIGQPAVSYAADSPTTVTNTWQKGAGLGMGRVQNSMLDFISTLLGMEKTAVLEERQAGKSMVSIAESKGVNEETLVNKVVEQRKAIIDQRVKDGTMTEEQAQLCEEEMDARIKSNLNRTTVGPADGARGGRGMRGGFQGGGRMGAMMRQQVQAQ